MSKIVKKYKLLNFNAYLEAKLSLDNLHSTLLLIDHLNETNKKEAVKMAKFYTENSEAFEASLAFCNLMQEKGII